MKRLLNVLGALVSDLTQSELAARGACRCHKFRSGGFGMELHTYGQALWNAKNITGSACVAVSRNWIWDPDETLFNLPRDKYCSMYGRHGMADQAWHHKESGYHSLVALVLAMQADAFVITSGSNWSRLMEELCLGRDLEPRCDLFDVTPWRPHDW